MGETGAGLCVSIVGRAAHEWMQANSNICIICIINKKRRKKKVKSKMHDSQYQNPIVSYSIQISK